MRLNHERSFLDNRRNCSPSELWASSTEAAYSEHSIVFIKFQWPHGRSVHVAGLKTGQRLGLRSELILPPPSSTGYLLHPHLLTQTTMVSTNCRRKLASSSGRTMTVMSINTEGLSPAKQQLIGKLCSDNALLEKKCNLELFLSRI